MNELIESHHKLSAQCIGWYHVVYIHRTELIQISRVDTYKELTIVYQDQVWLVIVFSTDPIKYTGRGAGTVECWVQENEQQS